MAFFNALCHAEFGARLPRTGSTYVTIGELWGLVIGWYVTLEHMIGAASIARAWSGGLDSILNGAVKHGTLHYVGHLRESTDADGSLCVSEYPDVAAMTTTLIMFTVIACGAKTSVNFNSVFTLCNGLVIFFIILVGFIYADTKYWINPDFGGFFPFGFSGTLAGATTCSYACVDFEGMAVSSEEAEKSVPLATRISFSIVNVVYMLVSSALTLIAPCFDDSLNAAFPEAL